MFSQPGVANLGRTVKNAANGNEKSSISFKISANYNITQNPCPVHEELSREAEDLRMLTLNSRGNTRHLALDTLHNAIAGTDF